MNLAAIDEISVLFSITLVLTCRDARGAVIFQGAANTQYDRAGCAGVFTEDRWSSGQALAGNFAGCVPEQGRAA